MTDFMERSGGMTEDDLETRDSNNGAPLLEALVVCLGALECVVVTVVAIWLWGGVR
jgi:hypothetical protein